MSKAFRCRVFSPDKQVVELHSFDEIEAALRNGSEVLYFDVEDPRDAEFEHLADLLDLHPLAVEDARKAHQRPKIEAYPNFWFIVINRITRTDGLLSVHEIELFCSDHFIVAVHDGKADLCKAIEQRWMQHRHETSHCSAALLYALLDTVVDSYIPIGEAFDSEIDGLEEGLFAERTTTHELLLDVFRLKRDLSDFRRAAAPMRNILSPIVRGEFTGYTIEDLAYFRDIDDHVARLVDSIDGAKDALVNAREAHIAFASHQQNEVTKQLSVVATIFLPLTFITGFFGQNFSWLTERIDGRNNFIVYGIGAEILALILLLGYFRYKRWF